MKYDFTFRGVPILTGPGSEEITPPSSLTAVLTMIKLKGQQELVDALHGITNALDRRAADKPGP